jgi:hypothetical protein
MSSAVISQSSPTNASTTNASTTNASTTSQGKLPRASVTAQRLESNPSSFTSKDVTIEKNTASIKVSGTTLSVKVPTNIKTDDEVTFFKTQIARVISDAVGKGQTPEKLSVTPAYATHDTLTLEPPKNTPSVPVTAIRLDSIDPKKDGSLYSLVVAKSFKIPTPPQLKSPFEK